MDKVLLSLVLSIIVGMMIFGMIGVVMAEDYREGIIIITAGDNVTVEELNNLVDSYNLTWDEGSPITTYGPLRGYVVVLEGEEQSWIEIFENESIIKSVSLSPITQIDDGGLTGCKNLFWFDDTTKICAQKQFCGAYMYLGLQTFNSKTQCEKALGNNSLEQQYNDYKSKYNLKYATYNEAVQTFQEAINNSDIFPDNYFVNKNELYFSTVETIIENGGEFGELGDCIYYQFNLVTGKSLVTKNACKFTGGESKTCPDNSDSENNSCFKTLSNGRKAEIKIMPETASATAIAKLGDLGFTIELKEKYRGGYDGKGFGDNSLSRYPVYELTGNKEGKFLGIFKIIAKVQAQVDAEDGSVKVIKPWWSFLATRI